MGKRIHEIKYINHLRLILIEIEMKKKLILLTLLLAFVLLASPITAQQLGTDNPCTFINDDPAQDIFCHSTDYVREGDTTYFLINVYKDKRLNISGAIVNAGDDISISGLYDPIGKGHSENNCAGSITGKCFIDHPTLGIWLLEIKGKTVPREGTFTVSSNFDIYKPRKYNKDTSILQDQIKFYKTYIKTGVREEPLAVSANWSDIYSNMEMTIITPDAKTKSDASKGDEKVVQAYYLQPGAVAEGTWITQLRALDARADLNFYSNYKFEYIEDQEIINGISGEKEIKEYPIIIKDRTTPLALTAIRLEAGDIVKIYSVFDPSGKKRSCSAYTDGCAIKDPEPGIWLVNLEGQTVTGHAPFRLASTHSTYIPEDYEVTDTIKNKGAVFYYTDIRTENNTHLVVVSNWTSYEPNMELTIISTNLKSVYDVSESDEKVAQKAFLVPGQTAEGRWIVQVKSIWKESAVTTKSNYNLTSVSTQSQINGDLGNSEKKTYYIEVTESKTPFVLTLTAFQSGDEFKITKVLKPDGKAGTCTKMPSGKESYTCAVKDPGVGIWTIEVTGQAIIGEGPFNLASTFKLTSCGNSVCDADENCGTCEKDCKCEKSICHKNACIDPPKTVGEKKTWLKDDLEDNLITQETYDARIQELATFSDSQLLSELTSDDEQKVEEENQKEQDQNNIIEKIKSTVFSPLTLIILIGLSPVFIILYKKYREKKKLNDYTKPISPKTVNISSYEFGKLNYLQKIKLILLDPHRFFEIMPITGGYKDPIIFYAITIIITLIPVSSLLIIFNPTTTGIAAMLTILIIGPIITIPLLFVFCALFHITLKILGGSGNYESTLRVMAYASAPNVVSWIPLAGILAMIYQVYISIIGYKNVHNISTLRIIIGMILICLIIGAILAIIILTIGLAIFAALTNSLQSA
ncbi:MAG: YIP1 family protein [archaeon]